MVELMKIYKWSLLFVAVFFMTTVHARRGSKIVLSEALKFELNQLLKATNELHSACHKSDEKQIDSSVKSVLSSIERAHQKSVLAEEQRTHLVKILNAAKGSLILSQTQTGESRRNSFKDAFRQLVQVVKIYKVDRYRVFFCAKDKSVWLQRSWKVKNPIHPGKWGDCGQLVN